jgi:polynucleotide 5'-kinase involved in rRNA processing
VKITKSLEEIKSFIHDDQLAKSALANVQEKGGDILLLRKDPNNDSLFMKMIREHRTYSQWFVEKYHSFEEDQWRELEKNLQIRLIETTDQTAVISREQFILTTDRIINRWLNETTVDLPFTVLICGEKDMGKSTFTRYLINRALNHINSTYDLTYFDCDIGQCEFTMGGCLSSVNLDSPLLGPPCSHMKSNPKPNRLLYYGLVSPQSSPIRYLQYIDRLRQLWNIDHNKQNFKRSMILINTMGWGTGKA